jgi:PBP1b-binding outer membrane lipoprotein LpoB
LKLAAFTIASAVLLAGCASSSPGKASLSNKRENVGPTREVTDIRVGEQPKPEVYLIIVEDGVCGQR